jgi:2-dehydro-3-deoxy-L-rhamnonate dehydrogenase (NAD+)
MRLKDKVALITGAGSGIGRAIALEFSREGAKTFVAELDEESGRAVVDEISAAGGQAQFHRCDVTQEADVQAAIQAAIDAFGGLNVMVNNAGVSRRDWDTTIAINLSGVYYGCKHGAEAIASHGGGAVINLSSILGLVGVGAEDGYVAAKHGVVGLTRNYAIAYAQRGVRVNCINPGFIETALTRLEMETQVIHDHLISQTPMARIGRPEEVAKAAVFLASDDASYVTGAPLIVDGGWTAR